MAKASIGASDTRVETVDGLRLFVRFWRPEGTARSVITLVPGFNAHSGYYAWAAEQLADRGVAVYAVDLRGRGHSDGERFYVEKFADYVSDVGAVVSLAKERESYRYSCSVTARAASWPASIRSNIQANSLV